MGTMQPMIRRILGIDVHVMTSAAAIEALDQRILLSLPTRVAFLNANLANIASKNNDLHHAMSSFFVLNDGIGVDIASLALFGERFPENLVGTDFIPQLLTHTRHNLRIALLGGQEHVLRETVKVFERRWPRHEIVFSHHGFLGPEEEDACVRNLVQAGTQLVLVGMGNPRQESWIGRNIPEACMVGIGVGALFDFLSGTVPRANPLLLRWRLEWLYRLCLEPRRMWRRYLIGNWVFLAHVLAAWIAQKTRSVPQTDVHGLSGAQ